MDNNQELKDIVDVLSRRILNYPKHINDTIPNEYSLIINCARWGYIDLVKRCINLGANLENCDDYNRTALWYALNINNFTIAETLLKAGANPNINIRYFDSNDTVPLCLWVIGRDHYIKKFELLLKYGAVLTLNKYRHIVEYYEHFLCDRFYKPIAKRRWVIVKCLTLTLSLHKRAVERVNHPERLKQAGVFEEI